MRTNAGHEQTLAFHIDAEMIDATFHIRQLDAAFQ